MNLDQIRSEFEQAAMQHFVAQREAGKAVDDNGSPPTPEALFWKDEQGNYGVKMFNAAWWGWKNATAVSAVYVQSLENLLEVQGSLKDNPVVSADFIRRTNEEYAAWCKTQYQPSALDDRGFPSLFGLWAWQEQERRKQSACEGMATIPNSLLGEIIGCFDAAISEGLYEALAETQDARLKDLLERRVMHAYFKAVGPEKALAPVNIEQDATQCVAVAKYTCPRCRWTGNEPDGWYTPADQGHRCPDCGAEDLTINY